MPRYMALPRKCFRRRTHLERALDVDVEDLIQFGQHVGVQFQLGGAVQAFEVTQGTHPDDGRRDGSGQLGPAPLPDQSGHRLGQEPGSR